MNAFRRFSSAPLRFAKRITTEELNELRRLRNEQARLRRRKDVISVTLYGSSLLIMFGTLTYASVPLYRAICSRTGFGGTPLTDQSKFTPDKMRAVDRDQRVRVRFSSEVSNQIPWEFKPEQREVAVFPGETALAFYKAKNVGTEPIIGMATYTVVPERAAAYFSKIQCFCFEEQMLMPGEEVDMPLFFFLDPDFVKDTAMTHINEIILHYTFFKAQYKDKQEEREVTSNLASQFGRGPENQAPIVQAS